MEIPSVKELVFTELTDDKTPLMTCVNCGKRAPGKGQFMSNDIHFASDATFNMVVCSKTCENKFRNNKNADRYIRAQVNYCRKLRREWAIKQQGRRHAN